MKEDENESLEVFKQKISLMPQLAYFRKNYWKQRYQIFNELYKILCGGEEKIDEKETKDIQLKDLDSDDSFSDIKNYNENNFKLFDDDNFRNLIGIDNDVNDKIQAMKL